MTRPRGDNLDIYRYEITTRVTRKDTFAVQAESRKAARAKIEEIAKRNGYPVPGTNFRLLPQRNE